jgi:hypothetical protein
MEDWDWIDILIMMGIVAAMVIGALAALVCIAQGGGKDVRPRPKR